MDFSTDSHDYYALAITGHLTLDNLLLISGMIVFVLILKWLYKREPR